MIALQLAMLAMAGTAVRYAHEVEACFAQAAAATGLHASVARILAVQGQAKRAVFEQLGREPPGPAAVRTARVGRS